MALRELVGLSAGLTAAVTNYTSGDQMGSLIQFATPTEYVGGSGVILGAHVVDDSGVLTAFDLALFSNTIAVAADNLAAATSAADGQASEGVLSFLAANLTNIGGRTVGTLLPVSGGHPFSLANPITGAPGNTLFGSMIARSAVPFFASTTSVRIKLLVQFV